MCACDYMFIFKRFIIAENSNFIAEKISNGSYSLSNKQKVKSFIWNVLCEILKEDGAVLNGWVYCRNCHKCLKYIGHQTSNLNRHKCCRALKQPTVLKTVTAEDKINSIEKCAAWVIEDCRPFSAIAGSGFKKLVQFFIKIGATYGGNVDVHDLLPDPTTISRKLQKSADEAKVRLKSDIKDVVNNGGASATIDMWTDSYVKRNFLGVTLHLQKDFKLLNFVLGMKSMDFERTTGDNILKKLNSLFSEFGVEDTKVVKFVTDRGSNIGKALQYHTRLNCSSHLFANVLQKSFDETTELMELLQSCKKIVRYFKKANLQHKLPSSLKNDCPTRWNSNYTMFKSIVDNWFDINELLKETEESQRLLHINISMLKCLVELCGDFQVVFNKMQLCRSPSLCYVIPSINKIQNLCAPNDADIAAISVLKGKVKENIEKVWVANLSIWHKTAFFLFPPAASMQPNDLNEIKSFCISYIDLQTVPPNFTLQSAVTIFPSDNRSLPTTSDLTSPVIPSPFSLNTPRNICENLPISPPTTSADPSPSTIQDSHFFFADLLRVSEMSSPENVAQEVERYSSEIVRMTEDFDLIEWWRNHSNVYPQLSKFALQIHSIPVSSAASERAPKSEIELGPKQLTISYFCIQCIKTSTSCKCKYFLYIFIHKYL